MRLFKYLPPTKWTVDALKNLQFYFARFNELNDPCELTISNCQKQELDMIRFKFLDPKDPNGIFCLSERMDNLHMWAQYADGHKGIVVEFETDEDKDFFREIDKVTYNDSPPPFDLKMKVRDVIYSKYTDSDKEQEWRVFEKHGPKKINPSAIKSIIFGYRFPLGCSRAIECFEHLTSDKDKQNAFIELDRLYWENLVPDTVEFYRTSIEHGQYSLNRTVKFKKPDRQV